MIEISLGSHYLASSALYKLDETFLFNINGKEFVTTKHHAICLSNKVKELFIQDNTINNLSIIVSSSSQESFEIFNALIHKGIYSGKISFNTSKELFLIGREIDNYDLIQQYSSYFEETELSLSNFNEFQDYCKQINDYSKCIKFICTNFDDINVNTLINILDNLGYDLIEQIMTNNDLNIISENKVVEVIIGLCQKSSKYKRLLQFIQLQFCSVEGVQTVLDYYDKTVCCDECKLFMDCFRKRLLNETKYDNSVRIVNFPEAEKLHSIPKSPKFFDEIYEIMNSYRNNDVFLRYAIKDGYNNIRSEKNNATVLLESAIKNNFELFKKLHELGDDIHVLDSNNHTALNWFAYKGNLKAVIYCASYLDVNSQNIYNDTPLHDACRVGRADVVRFLCSLQNIKINMKNNSDKTPLALCKRQDIKDILLAHGGEI